MCTRGWFSWAMITQTEAINYYGGRLLLLLSHYEVPCTKLPIEMHGTSHCRPHTLP
jgi:hypothetical protein